MKKGILVTAAVLLFVVVCGCSDNDDENAPDLRVSAFRSALKNSGFAASEGSTHQINPFQFQNS